MSVSRWVSNKFWIGTSGDDCAGTACTVVSIDTWNLDIFSVNQCDRCTVECVVADQVTSVTCCVWMRQGSFARVFHCPPSTPLRLWHPCPRLELVGGKTAKRIPNNHDSELGCSVKIELSHGCMVMQCHGHCGVTCVEPHILSVSFSLQAQHSY
jgi:hypothetical protein